MTRSVLCWGSPRVATRWSMAQEGERREPLSPAPLATTASLSAAGQPPAVPSIRSTTTRLSFNRSAILPGSLPPASAKSGRPPPPPPTIGAIWLDHLARLDFAGQVLGHRDDQRDLAVGLGGEHDHARLELVLERVGQRAQSCPVQAVGPAGDQRGAVQRDAVVATGASALAPPPMAALTLASCSSRVRRLTSPWSRSTAALRLAGARRRARAAARRAALLVAVTARRRRCRSPPRRGGRRPRRPLSEVIAKRPMSPVARTWVPPHSSRLKPGIDTTRTVSPYFSPNSAIAPAAMASAVGLTSVVTAVFCEDLVVDEPLDARQIARPGSPTAGRSRSAGDRARRASRPA